MTPSTRVGIGYDIHRLEAGRPLVLGGVAIPHTHGPLAHSDGDAVLHAVADALLGAAALGDLGEHFPDSDPQWAGAASDVILRRVVDMIRADGWIVTSADVNVILERPKLGPHKAAMRQRLADLLGVTMAAVGLKARTHEGLGPIGEGKAVAAQAVVVLTEKEA